MDGVLIVARPVGNGVVQYNDGDVVPLHQTLVYFGDTTVISESEISSILRIVASAAETTNPIMAKVIGHGVLGKDSDSVVFTESKELTALREFLVTNPLISDLMTRIEQHPNWISHVSGMILRFDDYITFDRLGFWYGDRRWDIPLVTNRVY